MTSKKTTRHALFSSVVALILCCSMLLGTTYAWFTDEVTSMNNVITAGNLDVDVVTADGNTINGQPTLFNEITLWEPGVVAYETLTVKNLGTLALKYQMVMSFDKVNASKTPTGKTLADVLKVGVVNEEIAQGTTREQLIAKVNNNWQKMESFSVNGQLEAGKDAAPMTLVIYWEPSDIDNEYNMNNGKVVSDFDVNDPNSKNELHIDLGVHLFATQLEAETDSFGPDYDEDAIYTDVVVTNEAELVEALANGKDDMIIGIKGNVTWTTGAGIGSTPFVENVTTFAANAAPIKNITLLGLTEDATFTAIGAGVGAIGIDGGTVTFKNLKIVDNSESYAENSWEFGYLEFRGNTVFENCDVVNAIMMSGDNATFKNCSFNSHKDSEYAVWVDNGNATFENCTFTGARGLKMHEAYGSEVGTVVANNNTFIELSMKPGIAIGTVNPATTVVITNNLFAGTQAGDQGLYSYETDTDVTTFTFIYDKSNTVAGYANTNTELSEQLQNNATVVMPAGEFSLPSMSGKEGITIIGAADGSTVVGGENSSTGFGSNFGKNTTIKNVTFSGTSNGVRWSYANGGTSTFENCTFAGDSTYGFHIDESHGATFIFNNCTFSGFNAFAGDLVKVVFNNCTFLNNGNYGHTNIWSVAELNNCTFTDETSISGGKLYFNGVEESYHHEFIGSAESLFAFAESVNVGANSWNGQKVVLVADIDLNNAAWTPIGQTGATQFKGTFDGNGYTIYNLNVDSSAETGKHYSSGLFGWAESGVTIKNVKIDGAKVVGNHNVAVIVGYTYSGKISNCHVANAEIIGNHANDDACGDKVGLIAGYAGDESRFTNCSGADSTVKSGRDAGQLIGAGYNVSLANCAATDVAVTAIGECTGANVNNTVIGRVMG